MPHTLCELLRGEALTVSPNERVTTALTRMTQHDYSQLPVLDAAGGVRGLVTYESIMRALRHIGGELLDLQVSAAMVRAEKHGPDEDLFDVLPTLERTGSVLVVSTDGRLQGIVTNYDVMEYFRSRAEDMMLVEDIETMIRDLILHAFADGSGNVDEAKLSKAIGKISDRRDDLRKQFRKGVGVYLNETGEKQVKSDLVERSFEAAWPGGGPKPFEDLTLNEFIDLLCSPDRWEQIYRPLLGMSADQLRALLAQVRDTRNALAHFRREISDEERQRLGYVMELLGNHMPPARVGQSSIPIAVPEPEPEPEDASLPSIEEEMAPGESRYARLGAWLSKLPGKTKEITLKFDQIEGIVGGALPPSAREHRAWWANDSVGHVQSRQWLNAGWRTTYISMSDERVTFTRIKGRQSSYMAFFTTLLDLLKADGRLSPQAFSVQGTSWFNIIGFTIARKRVAWLAASFTSRGRFRIELYIDGGDRAWNKRAFDRLREGSAEIERRVGEPLSWERLDDGQASRVACYREGNIMEPANHEQLQAWAVQMVARFNEVVVPPALAALEETRGG